MTLSLTDVAIAFSGVVAVDTVSLDVVPGRVLAVLGPNGAGKTSVVNIACGSVRPDHGSVTVDEKSLTGRGPRQFAAAGVVRTFQALRLFDSMTVQDNVLVGGHGARRLPLAAALLRSPGFRQAEKRLGARAAASLETVGMSWAADRPVTSLSHGQRRRVELARALASSPTYLVLDEPGAGLDPDAVSELGLTLRRLAEAGLGLLIVEHDAGLVERVADDCLAMLAGKVVACGSFADVSRQADIAAQLAAG